MLRSILSLLAGFISWTCLWLGSNALLSVVFADLFQEDGSTDSVGILILLIVLSVIISVLSGYLLARLSTRDRLRQGFILGVILLVVGIFVQLQFWTLLPVWYHLSFLILLLPSTYAGAKIFVSLSKGA